MNLKTLLQTSLATLLLIGAFTAFSGCATIVRGTHQDVQVTSDPANARVIVNGEDRGETPTTLALGTNEDYQIQFEKDGYATETVNVNKEFTIGWPVVGNVFSWGLLGIVVDVAGGAAYKLEPEQVQAALNANGGTSSVQIPEGSDVHVVLFTTEQLEQAGIDVTGNERLDLDVQDVPVAE